MGKVPAKVNKSLILHAPHVIHAPLNSDNSAEHKYTKQVLADFLGWTSSDGKRADPNFAFQTAFRALELIEQGYIEPKHIQGKKRDEGFGVSMI